MAAVMSFDGETGGTATAIRGLGDMAQARSTQEVQAAMVIAKKFPRDETRAYTKIMKSCDRPSLAEVACYAYKRGGQIISGPSIRLAEVLAQNWGNMQFGVREISRHVGYSEVEAFAWDLENNTYRSLAFTVPHSRDTKEGSKPLTDSRDIYEVIANMGARRVRACILAVIPGDVVEAARLRCEKTLAGGGNGKPLQSRARDMILAFGEFGVDQDMIEGFLQHKITGITEPQMVKLIQIYRSIRDGVGKVEEFFGRNQIGGGGAGDLEEKLMKAKPKPKANPETKAPQAETETQSPETETQSPETETQSPETETPPPAETETPKARKPRAKKEPEPPVDEYEARLAAINKAASHDELQVAGAAILKEQDPARKMRLREAYTKRNAELAG